MERDTTTLISIVCCMCRRKPGGGMWEGKEKERWADSWRLLVCLSWRKSGWLSEMMEAVCLFVLLKVKECVCGKEKRRKEGLTTPTTTTTAGVWHSTRLEVSRPHYSTLPLLPQFLLVSLPTISSSPQLFLFSPEGTTLVSFCCASLPLIFSRKYCVVYILNEYK